MFGKLYAATHVRSDRWYKLGRTLLYGRLEDEKPFHSVRRLVQYEDYVLRLLSDAGLPVAHPLGIVEITPEREYLLVTEFFDGAREIGEADIDEAIIDQGLSVVRRMWEIGLAHRDIKPANLLVRDGTLFVIDTAFAEVRPSPWRQAVDLANMMLVLGLRTERRAGVRAGPAAVLRRGDRRGLRRHPRPDHAVPAAPHAAPAGPGPARRLPQAAALPAAADPHPALDLAAGRAHRGRRSSALVLARRLIVDNLLGSPL